MTPIGANPYNHSIRNHLFHSRSDAHMATDKTKPARTGKGAKETGKAKTAKPGKTAAKAAAGTAGAVAQKRAAPGS